MRRTETRTSAPILRSLRRMVAQLALANCVRLRPMRRKAQMRTYAKESEDALADQRLDSVLDQFLAAPVAKAGGEPIDDPDRPIGRAEQQRPRIRGDASAVESRDHPPTFNGCKSKQIRDTLWLHRGAPRILLSCCDHNKFR